MGHSRLSGGQMAGCLLYVGQVSGRGGKGTPRERELWRYMMVVRYRPREARLPPLLLLFADDQSEHNL